MGTRSSKSRLSRKWIIFIMLGLGASAFAAMKMAFTTEISSDPYTNQSQKTEVEPDSYSYGSTIVTAFQVGRFADGGAVDIGWATSKDNGKSWQHGFLPALTKYQGNGPFDRGSDASVAYDAKHGVWLVSTLAVSASGGNVNGAAVVVSRSADGLNWQAPVNIYGEGISASLDKNWTTCDNWPQSPHYGNCYTEWDEPGNWGLIDMSTSTDGGLTWGAPKNTAEQASGLGGQPVVQPNGTVVVPIGDENLGNLQSFVSTDGGQSWSSVTAVASMNAHDVGNGVRTEPLPSAAVDANGKVYVVWQDCRFESNCSANDMVMTTTTDGVNWSPVVRIPTEPVGSNVDHFIPGLAIDRATTGAAVHLSLTYYFYPDAGCNGTDCQLRVATVQSLDGGASWSAPVEMGQNFVDWATVPSTTMGPMVGDYISSSFGGSTAYPIFALSSKTDGLAMNSIAANQMNARTRVFTPVRVEPTLSLNKYSAQSLRFAERRKPLRLF